MEDTPAAGSVFGTYHSVDDVVLVAFVCAFAPSMIICSQVLCSTDGLLPH